MEHHELARIAYAIGDHAYQRYLLGEQMEESFEFIQRALTQMASRYGLNAIERAMVEQILYCEDLCPTE